MKTKQIVLFALIILCASSICGQLLETEQPVVTIALIDVENVFKGNDYGNISAMIMGNSFYYYYAGDESFHFITTDFTVYISNEDVTLDLIAIGYFDANRNGWSTNDRIICFWNFKESRYTQSYTYTEHGMREITEGTKPWDLDNPNDKYLNMLICNLAISHTFEEFSRPAD